MKSVFCIIELFTPYDEYGERHSIGFVGTLSDGSLCHVHSRCDAYKFTEDEAERYAKLLIPQYSVKVYHYDTKQSKPMIEHIKL